MEVIVVDPGDGAIMTLFARRVASRRRLTVGSDCISLVVSETIIAKLFT